MNVKYFIEYCVCNLNRSIFEIENRTNNHRHHPRCVDGIMGETIITNHPINRRRRWKKPHFKFSTVYRLQTHTSAYRLIDNDDSMCHSLAKQRKPSHYLLNSWECVELKKEIDAHFHAPPTLAIMRIRITNYRILWQFFRLGGEQMSSLTKLNFFLSGFLFVFAFVFILEK